MKIHAAHFAAAFSILATAHAQLAAFTKDTRILFQGDSITDGNRGRNTDPNHILGHGYAFIIAAKHGAESPQLALTFMNRGMSGNTVDLKPDLISILIGVNDSGKNIPLDQYEAVYNKLLTTTIAANPNIKLVLCASFGLPVGKKKDTYETWSADIKAQQTIVEKLAQKHHAALVRFQPLFETACKRANAEYWIWDGVHLPTTDGREIIMPRYTHPEADLQLLLDQLKLQLPDQPPPKITAPK